MKKYLNIDFVRMFYYYKGRLKFKFDITRNFKRKTNIKEMFIFSVFCMENIHNQKKEMYIFYPLKF